MSDPNCIFCRIVKGEIPSYPIWESDSHVAFLTPTPNTPGFTVVIPKDHHDSNVLQLDEKVYTELLLAARSVAQRIEKGLGVARVGMVAEGMGVNHAHVKLIPMHGFEAENWHPIAAAEEAFSEIYQGFLTTHEGPRMDQARLAEIQKRIQGTSA